MEVADPGDVHPGSASIRTAGRPLACINDALDDPRMRQDLRPRSLLRLRDL
ncbi:hypothetical protein ACQP2Y_38070 [Actinoplanes sp. CA-051413]|uniref:hypothetical protein n=1 Tax=Actinoplanes sp. CA-051413 TaxID=3239899 RepID=UPI003D99ADE4